jgi:DNA-binding NtrC family response regulator
MGMRVLIVSHRAGPRGLLGAALIEGGCTLLEAADGLEGFACFQREAPDLVVSDLEMPRCDGIGLLRRIRLGSSAPVIIYASGAGPSAVVAALRSGADDFVDAEEVPTKEFAARTLARLPSRGWERPGTAALLVELPGGAPAILRARRRVEALAPLDEPVLVTGEPGTGRESAARALHRLGRPESPFLGLDAEGLGDWPTLPKRGSVYVGAVERLSGCLQESWVRELEAPRYDVRWLASGPPSTATGHGPLLPELAARLRRFELPLPTLRERPEDVPRIARQSVERIGSRMGRHCRLSERAMRRLRAHHWSRNVAELESVVEKLVAFTKGSEIGAEEVENVLSEVGFSVEGLRHQREQDERGGLIAALEETGGNVTRTAALLGRSRAAVYRMVERHGVPLRRHTDM